MLLPAYSTLNQATFISHLDDSVTLLSPCPHPGHVLHQHLPGSYLFIFKVHLIEVKFIQCKMHRFQVCSLMSFGKCIHLCNHHHNQGIEHSSLPPKFPPAPSQSPAHLHLYTVVSADHWTDFCHYPWAWLFLEFHISRVIKCEFIFAWLILLSIVFEILLCCCMDQWFVPFYWVSSIPLYGSTAVYPFTCGWAYELSPVFASCE